MPELSDTALVILSNAAKRDERLVLPLPKSVKGGLKAATPILKNLLKKKLIAELAAMASMPVWREDGDNRLTLIATDAGLRAIGVEESNEVAQPAKKSAKAAKPRKTAKSKPATASSGQSKLDLLKEMLGRKEGMTVAEASKATGWLMHSVRGVMSGVFKKKQGLDIKSEKIEGRGRVYRLAR